MSFKFLDIAITCIGILLCLSSFGQTTIVTGKVIDAKSKEPLHSVIIHFAGSTVGTATDMDGNFKIQTSDLSFKELKISLIGYKSISKTVEPGKEQNFLFRLVEIVNELQEVKVEGKKGKYRNKDNPAVELIKKVIESKSKNRNEGFDYLEFEKYEKMQFALSNINEELRNHRLLKKFQVVFSNLDSSKLEGKAILPFYLKENLSEVKYRKSPKAYKEVIKASKKVTFDGYIDDEGLSAYAKFFYKDINIYDNNVLLFSNQFLSPISDVAPTFYKFAITDTLLLDSVKCTKLSFVPRNKNDFLFQGDLFITMDGAYAVKGLEMTVSKDINLNWVKELLIKQEFAKQEQQGYTLVHDELMADFGVNVGIKKGIFGQRITSYSEFKINQPREDKAYEGLDVVELEDAKTKPDSFWVQERHTELSRHEQGIYTMIDSVKKVPAFKKRMKLAMLVFAGYKNFGTFEIGPVTSFYSFSPPEGLRLRFGGRTTPQFSKKIFLDGYTAYGFKDEKLKYYALASYSFTKRTIWQFPVKSLKAFYMSDIKIPGQELQLTQEDNLFYSFKRGTNDKFLYNELFGIEYLNEFPSHFSFAIGYKYWQQNPTGSLHFNKTDYNDHSNDIHYVTTSEASLILRYAPNEIFYQGKVSRSPITTKYPVFTFRYITGLKGVFGGEYSYHNLMLNISKRFYLSQFGITDVTMETGKIFGQVPFPLLIVHRANQTYAYQTKSFNLMNFLEFVSDEYQALYLDHNFNGFFFNKIPLFKKLKWRELMSVKVLYGKISQQNNPEQNANLFKLPVTPEGEPITYSLEEKPYIEGSVGIGNILKFFRVDLVRRFTYLDHPTVTEFGIRIRMKFDF